MLEKLDLFEDGRADFRESKQAKHIASDALKVLELGDFDAV